MRKLVAAALAASAVVGGTVAVATPATAQPWGNWHRPYHRPIFYGPRPIYGPYAWGYGYRPYYRPFYRPYGHHWRRW